MANNEVKKENTSKFVKDLEEKGDPVSVDQIGSEEFYQGEKVVENITLSGEKKTIKTETVKKEEIYKNKEEQADAFIASLGRKKEEENPENSQPEYVEEKSSLGKKVFFSFLILVILGAIAGGGYFWWLKKQAANQASENKNLTVIPANPQTSSDNSTAEKKTDEKKQIAEVAPADMNVKVLNEGAAAGSAGKVKTLLIGKGYAKTEADNGQGENVVGSAVYYKGEQFKKAASALQEILTGGKIKSEVKEALTTEQQSADVVVILGK